MKKTYIRDIVSNNTEYTLLGWIANKRVHGGIIFLDITDSTGTIQAVLSRKNVDKCVFETHNMNGLIPHAYLTKLGITSVQELINL